MNHSLCSTNNYNNYKALSQYMNMYYNFRPECQHVTAYNIIYNDDGDDDDDDNDDDDNDDDDNDDDDNDDEDNDDEHHSKSLKKLTIKYMMTIVLEIKHDNCINKQTQALCNNDSQEIDVGNGTASVISVYGSIISTERVSLLPFLSLGRNIRTKRLFF